MPHQERELGSFAIACSLHRAMPWRPASHCSLQHQLEKRQGLLQGFATIATLQQARSHSDGNRTQARARPTFTRGGSRHSAMRLSCQLLCKQEHSAAPPLCARQQAMARGQQAGHALCCALWKESRVSSKRAMGQSAHSTSSKLISPTLSLSRLALALTKLWSTSLTQGRQMTCSSSFVIGLQAGEPMGQLCQTQ